MRYETALDLIKAGRSIRGFTDEAVARETVKDIPEAACQARDES